MNAPAEFARAVCPHDCPDTCAMRVTVKDGKAIKVSGDPDHPPTQGVLCTKVSRYAERTHHRGSAAHAAASASAAKARDASRRSAGTRRCASPRSPEARSQRARPKRSCRTATPARWAWCRAKAWPRASSTRSARRGSTARSARRPARRACGHLRRQARHAHRVLRRERTDPHLGQQIRSRRTCISGRARRKPSVAARG